MMLCSCIILMLIVIPLFFLLHFPMTCSLTVHNSSACHMDDNFALLQFRSSITIGSFTIGANNCDGVAYAKTASWRDGTECCKWDGVQCDAATGRVIGLDLSCSLLRGNINSSSSLFLLPHLQSLDLSRNQLIGALPSSANVSWNSSLREIFLSDNQLTGMIPSWLFALPCLQQFYLHDNQFTGQISEFKSSSLIEINLSNNNLSGTTDLNMFSRLENLTYLSLANNNLSVVMMTGTDASSGHARWDMSYLNLASCNMSEIPESLGVHQSQGIVDLSKNRIHGEIPKWMKDLRFLMQLNLSYNSLTGGLENLPWVFMLDISFNLLEGPMPDLGLPISGMFFAKNNRLRGEIPLSICNVSFYVFDVSNNGLSGEIPPCLFSSSSWLQTLDLRHNKLNGSIPPNIEMFNLEVLLLSGNLLEGQVPPSLAKCLALEVLDLGNNRLSGGIPSSICHCPHLSIFDVSNNSLSGEIPTCYSSLQILDLSHNKLNGSLPPSYEMCNLSTLQLSGNQLEGHLPPSLAKCGSLEVLDLGNNGFTGTFPYWLDTLPELQVLILRNNRFQGVISSPTTKDPFPKLQILDLSGNNFSGPLPRSYMENFTAMKHTVAPNESLHYIGSDLSNYYQVSIALTMKGSYLEYEKILRILTAIDLSNNRFQGEIPGTIGQLISLVSLNLSHNYLGSQIPPSLGNLTMLESLDLSFNNLTGQIPQHLANLQFLEYFNVSENRLIGPIPRGKQFDTFLNDSYFRNPELCGFPLRECGDTAHQPMPPPISHEEDDSDSTHWFEWEIILMGYGCGLVIGLVSGWYMFLLGTPFCLLKWIYKVEFLIQKRQKKKK